MRTLKIDPEFRDLLPPLTEETLTKLEASIVKDGCLDSIKTWQGIIVDGHNRYAICTKRKIGFDTTELDFPDRDAAMDWIDDNQLQRRNLTPDEFRLALGRQYLRMKQRHGGQTSEKGMGNNYPSPPRTSEQLAAKHGVSEKTVRTAGKFAEEVEANPELKKAVAERKPTAQLRREIKEKEEADKLVRHEQKPDGRRRTRLPDVVVTNAGQIAVQAIVTLDRILDTDPTRVEAFQGVISYCNKRINKPKP